MKKTLLCSALLAALMSVSSANAAIVFQDNIGLIGSNASSFSFSFDTTSHTISTSAGSLGGGWTSGTWSPSGSVEMTPGYPPYYFSAKLALNSVNTGSTTYGTSGGGAVVGANPFYGSINYSGTLSASQNTIYAALSAFKTVGQVYTGWAAFTSSSDGSAFQLDAIAFNDFATTNNTYQSVIKNGDTGNGMYVANVASPSAVPIPAAAWLMASGLGVFGAAARKRKAQAA
jgi:hypothetical protein